MRLRLLTIALAKYFPTTKGEYNINPPPLREENSKLRKNGGEKGRKRKKWKEKTGNGSKKLDKNFACGTHLKFLEIPQLKILRGEKEIKL